jgi:hypothetical protein
MVLLMKPLEPHPPLETLPIGTRSCRVGALTADHLVTHREDVSVIAETALAGNLFADTAVMSANVRLTRALIEEHHPDISDEEIRRWMSAALSTSVAMEWVRQAQALRPRLPRARQRIGLAAG